jgi:hypothetical protein
MRRRKPKHTVRISMRRGNIIVETLDDTRVSHHGGATYLIRYRPKEISITQEAKDALMKCHEIRHDAGMEFLSGNVLKWASLSEKLAIPIEYVSVQECIKPMINRFFVID